MNRPASSSASREALKGDVLSLLDVYTRMETTDVLWNLRGDVSRDAVETALRDLIEAGRVVMERRGRFKVFRRVGT